MSLFLTISCLFFLTNSLSAKYLDEKNPDLKEELKEKWNTNLYNQEALQRKLLKGFYSFLETLISNEMKYLDENVPLNIDLKKETYEYNNLDEFKVKGNRFYGKVLYAIKWIDEEIDSVNQSNGLNVDNDRDLKYLSSIQFYLQKTKLKFENHWESIFNLIEEIKQIEAFNYHRHIFYFLTKQFENKDYIESMKMAFETTDDLINNRNYYLVTGFVSSEKVDFLNGVDRELKVLFGKYDDSQFYENVEKKNPLTDSYHRFGTFLEYEITMDDLPSMRANFPFKVDLEELDLKKMSNEIENEFKFHANRFYRKILFAIEWNNKRIDFISKNAESIASTKKKVKEVKNAELDSFFYKQDLISLSMVKQKLNGCRELFIEHLEKLFSKIEAYESNQDQEKRIFLLREVDKEINNQDFAFLLNRAHYIVQEMKEEKSKELLYTKWRQDIEPNLKKSLDIENYIGFLQDFQDRKALGKYYEELLAFLKETRKIMDDIKDNIPFDIKGSKLSMNDKVQKFKSIANECYQRLSHAELWVKDRSRLLEYYKHESTYESYQIIIKYENDRFDLNEIDTDVFNANGYLQSYMYNINKNIDAYTTIESKYFKSGTRKRIIDSLQSISRKRYFIGKINDGIELVTKLIGEVTAGKGTFEDDTENQEYKDTVSDEINGPKSYTDLADIK